MKRIQTNGRPAGAIQNSAFNNQWTGANASITCDRLMPSRQVLGECTMGCVSRPETHRKSVEATTPPCLLSRQQHTVIDLQDIRRIALMVTPQCVGTPIDQAWEAVSTIRAIMLQQPVAMTVSMQTIFVKSAELIPAIRRLLESYFMDTMPATTFIVQPPAGGQALAIEAWALGGKDVEVDFPTTDIVTVQYNDMRWIHVGGIVAPEHFHESAYAEAEFVFADLAGRLDRIGATMADVPRVWLYQDQIVELESGTERYRELNRARTDFFDQQNAAGFMKIGDAGQVIYPASTGIGMTGGGLTISALGLQTDRDDIVIRPLENPSQTSAFDYDQRFSLKSPKFARAMAMSIDDYVTTWVSGTASILESESVHLGDAEKQTEQTIDNIQRLISPENMERHGFQGVHPQLADIAKLRVYVKNPEDKPVCEAVCRRRFGDVPAIYAIADVCRPELLVEIEGVAFTKRQPDPDRH
ncbi:MULTISPECIES: dioxygenase [Crateriforma]|uniref:Putative aminoacrylate peracid reductase RutC n=1 Tax=Crateriforma conspicua TaxID=2527996 RepID=A0A5C6FTM7_9PLAN|nr:MULTISPECIES: dioxygenase [Crateriforma]TWU65701.1 putative aminoacrylate peracid reductase RutC [Crateriforma conspicua]